MDSHALHSHKSPLHPVFVFLWYKKEWGHRQNIDSCLFYFLVEVENNSSFFLWSKLKTNPESISDQMLWKGSSWVHPCSNVVVERLHEARQWGKEQENFEVFDLRPKLHVTAFTRMLFRTIQLGQRQILIAQNVLVLFLFIYLFWVKYFTTGPFFNQMKRNATLIFLF